MRLKDLKNFFPLKKIVKPTKIRSDFMIKMQTSKKYVCICNKMKCFPVRLSECSKFSYLTR